MARVLLFGSLADAAGWREREVEADAISDLRDRLAMDDAALGLALGRPGVQVALDKTLTRGDAERGLMTVRLQTQPLRPGELLDAFAAGRRETGAIVSFTGLMRAENGAADTLHLDAYPGFTEAEIARTEAQAQARFGLQDSLIAHRHGAIAPGEAIVFVAAAAAHRRAAFEAADHVMDYLKSRAPFWKRSSGPSGGRWIEPTAQDFKDAARWDVVPWDIAPAAEDAG